MLNHRIVRNNLFAAVSTVALACAAPAVVAQIAPQPQQIAPANPAPADQAPAVPAPAQAPVRTDPTAPAATLSGPADFSQLALTRQRSVVAITTRRTVEERQPAVADDSPFGEALRRYYDDPRQRQRQRQRTSLGSGFLVDQAGHIVTNNHVVGDASEIRVILHDRTTRTARVVGRDLATDIAVLKLVDPAGDYPAVEWGDSDALQPGNWTIAIGSPFGLGGTVTVGVLSARSRDINAGPYDDFLQTDASINSGNSGGPLFNAQGQVIGVNTAIVSPSGGNIGIGFAVPSNIARQVTEQIISGGRVERGFVGVSLQPLTAAIVQALRLPNADGALVAQVEPGSPAAEAGVRPGDVITQFGGRSVTSARALSRLVAQRRVGESVPIEVARESSTQQLTVAIGRRDDRNGASPPNPQREAADQTASTPRLGLVLAPLGDQQRQRLGLDGEQGGVVVRRVDPAGPAGDDGVRVGDVIVEANGRPITQPDDIGRIWQEALTSARPLLLRLRRGNSALFVAVDPAGR